MKIIYQAVLLLALASCGNTKQVVEETAATKDFDKTVVINDTVTVSNGKLIGTTKPVSEMPVINETPQEPVSIETNTTEPDPATVVEKDIPLMTVPPVEMNSIIHDAFNTLLKSNVSSAGNVNYNSFKSNRKALLDYITVLGENLPDDNWSQNEKLAYWMNAYNAMTIDLILRHQPLESIKDIKNPWEQRYWKLGEKYYNLDEIEHQILRKMGDARIHFGINCASFSCPPLLNEAFVPSKVNAQLETVAKKFINDKSRNMISENSVEISNIFKWFSKDFKQNGSVIDYLNQYSNVQISENARVRYMDYDWSLNK